MHVMYELAYKFRLENLRIATERDRRGRREAKRKQCSIVIKKKNMVNWKNQSLSSSFFNYYLCDLGKLFNFFMLFLLTFQKAKRKYFTNYSVVFVLEN